MLLSLLVLDAFSKTSTMLRLALALNGKGDGRYVHLCYLIHI